MVHSLRPLLNFVFVVVLAMAGMVRGEVVCVSKNGHVAVEAAGECEDHREAPGTPSEDAEAPCVDFPLEQVSAGRTEGKLPQVVPPQAVLDVAALVTPVVIRQARVTPLDVRAPSHAAPPTHTVVLLI
jgi:hypothetical protein